MCSGVVGFTGDMPADALWWRERFVVVDGAICQEVSAVEPMFGAFQFSGPDSGPSIEWFAEVSTAAGDGLCSAAAAFDVTSGVVCGSGVNAAVSAVTEPVSGNICNGLWVDGVFAVGGRVHILVAGFAFHGLVTPCRSRHRWRIGFR